MNSSRPEYAEGQELVDEPAYEMAERPEPSVEQRLAFYATYREIGGSPIEELEQLRAEVEAQESKAA